MGMIPIWGNITPYVTSYLRVNDPTLTTANTFIIFPMTILLGAIFMQLGSYLMEKIHPRIQMTLGCILFAGPIIAASYMTNFGLFFFFYSCVLGFGFGLIYMLPIRNAWMFFPEKKGMVSGVILSCYSLGAIAWSFLTTYLANPTNEHSDADHLYGPNSDVVANVPHMLRVMSYIFIAMGFVAVLLISKKNDPPIGRKAVLFIGGDYHTNASVSPISSVGSVSPGMMSPARLMTHDDLSVGSMTPKLGLEPSNHDISIEQIDFHGGSPSQPLMMASSNQNQHI